MILGFINKTDLVTPVRDSKKDTTGRNELSFSETLSDPAFSVDF